MLLPRQNVPSPALRGCGAPSRRSAGGSQELPWPGSPNMEHEAEVSCEPFEANMLTQSCCQNCLHPEEAHGARHQELGSSSSVEAPYYDLPRCPPAPEDPLSTSTSDCQSAVGQGPKSICLMLLKGVTWVVHALGTGRQEACASAPQENSDQTGAAAMQRRPALSGVPAVTLPPGCALRQSLDSLHPGLRSPGLP
ncbi:Hypothetical predicted protein [Marmota monax]|uniref:Uncharacterized protein n=2 Tax=Marmota monax TaxID=9995 RepID=A0A5E4BRU2_MARMO|nr:Hypothetical predicted protein [Marmota monax]